MITVYLAGPIDANSKKWRKKAWDTLEAHNKKNKIIDPEVMRWRAQQGYKVLDPEVIEVQDDYNNCSVVNTDLNLIHRSDILLVNLTSKSTGTPMEMVYGKMWNKLVITVIADKDRKKILSPWHIYHSTRVVSTLQGALQLITSNMFEIQ